MLDKFIRWSGVIALLAILLLVAWPSNLSTGATGTRFPNGLSTDSTSPSSGQVRSTTLTVTGASTLTGAATLSSTLSLAGLATLNAGQLKSYTNASSSVTTGTLRVSDVADYDTVLLTPTGAAAAKTLTFFATSSASTWLPAAGDRQDTCFFNSTSTAGVDIIFAAGTGIDFEVASSSATALGGLNIGPNSGGCFTFIRQPSLSASFDISALYTAFEDAD